MRAPPRHAFRFKIDVEGQSKILTAMAKIRYARKSAKLTLTTEDVRRSIKLKGAGNTQTCPMAICAKRHASAFSHPVDGYIDWQYSRAYVVSKVSKETGMPIECVPYEHSDDIAKLNDSKGGQEKLLRMLEAGGDRIIRLTPVKRRKPYLKPRGEGRKDGTRSSRPVALGAKLRFAVAQLGGVPA